MVNPSLATSKTVGNPGSDNRKLCACQNPTPLDTPRSPHAILQPRTHEPAPPSQDDPLHPPTTQSRSREAFPLA